ncbi:hypothetical protein COO91_07544 [Nostoc flagelliforme CCNUN1]|uniref:Uncharacterized protein n=1 Tax=Nostoc flagelliforme CCNUN1 TaxID=2038116 RepID=A0A2K8T1C2_9NOSO|nr:hypothetical protein COO91_07544 [Nostoc flagelliforme CCNUN1]
MTPSFSKTITLYKTRKGREAECVSVLLPCGTLRERGSKLVRASPTEEGEEKPLRCAIRNFCQNTQLNFVQ